LWVKNKHFESAILTNDSDLTAYLIGGVKTLFRE